MGKKEKQGVEEVRTAEERYKKSSKMSINLDV